MKYIKQIKAVAGFALATIITLSGAGIAHADPWIMYPGVPQSYATATGYVGPTIMDTGSSTAPVLAPVIPTIVNTPTTYSNPVINSNSFNNSQNQNSGPVQVFVSTTGANAVGQTTATLNGSWSMTNATQLATWFEYGTSTATMNTVTATRYHSAATGATAETVTGLTPNTTYYFRTVGESNGTFGYGTVRTFVTSAAPSRPLTQILGVSTHAATATTIQNNQSTTGMIAGSESTNVCSGDTVNYTINYVNPTNGTIQNAMLVITMPAGIDYKSATATASYSAGNRMLTIFVGTMTAGQTGAVYVQGLANSGANGVATIATRVDFNYTNSQGANATTTSYITHSGLACANALGANALGSGFFPTSPIGWIILIAIVCVIVFVSRKFFANKKEEHIHAEHLEHQVH